MPSKIVKHRRGTKEAWERTSQILEDGEIGVQYNKTTNTVSIKVGDGTHTYPNLPELTISKYAEKNSVDAEIKTLNSRINQIIAPDGTTTTLEELIDIRNGNGDEKFESAGEAVRSASKKADDANTLASEVSDKVSEIDAELTEFKENINDMVDITVVDGLKYVGNDLFLTAGGEVLADSKVTIVGGTGGGEYTPVKTSIKLAGGFSNTFSVASGKEANVGFSFTSLEDGEPTGDCSCTINVDGVPKKTFTIKQGVENIIDVSEYLTNGLNAVTVTCSDIYAYSKSLLFNITVIKLEVKSIFDDSEIRTGDFEIRYTPYGIIDKVANFWIDDGKIKLTSGILNDTISGRQQTQKIPALSHGAHKIEIFLSASIDDDDIESDRLVYEIICREEGNDKAIIASSYDVESVKQGELISIPYIVYDPTKFSVPIKLSIYQKDAGELKLIDEQDREVNSQKQFWNVRNVPLGDLIFIISYGKLSKSHNITVTKNDISVTPVTDKLQLYLSSSGRSNDDKNRSVWKYGDITTTFENFNWKTNGWVNDKEDGSGDVCLRLNGDARATINFMPFKEDFRAYGKTIEFEFAVRDVNNRNAVVIDCFDAEKDDKGEETGKGIGIRATADTAYIKSEGTSVSCNYTEDQKLRLGFSIERQGNGTRFISIYLDGVLSGVTQYTTGDNFAQDTAMPIVLGSDFCGLDIYTIRIYDSALTASEMLDNYIYDMTNMEDKFKVYEDNNIYDAHTQKLSYKMVKKKIPTVTFIGKMPTFKGDKKKNSVRMIFEHPTKPEINFDEILEQIDVQGTSSAGYVRKNWKTKHGTKHTHMEGELPAKVFCLKVDYAEGTGTHNTQNANFVETLYTEKVLPQYDEERVRTTITGFPIVIFHLDTDNAKIINGITTADLESRTDVVFSSKGNFNYDKDAEDVFGFTSKYDTECWEFCNNTAAAPNFLAEIGENYASDFEARYHPKLSQLEKLEEATVKDEEAIANLRAEMIARFKVMHDWVVSTNESAATGRKLALDYVDVLGNVYTHDTSDYRIAKFKTEFSNYFDLYYTAVYYVYTFFALMVDQRAKNLFLTYWRDRDSNGNILPTGKWYPYFYDNDTSYGINNEGKKVFDYYHEDSDIVDGQPVYNGQMSTLWVNFKKAFPTVIRDVYAEMRSGPLTEENLVNQVIGKGSDMWSASIYNEDAEYKYVSLARPDYDPDGDGKPNTTTDFLYQVTGNGEHHFKYFVHNRLKYCDSKWYAGNYFSDRIYLRIYTPTTIDVGRYTDRVTYIAKEDGVHRFVAPTGFGIRMSTSYTPEIDFETNTNPEGEFADIQLEKDVAYEVRVDATIRGDWNFTVLTPSGTSEEVHCKILKEQDDDEIADATAKNEIIEASVTAVPPNANIKLTPYSNVYAGVRYKASSGDDITLNLRQHRATKNNEVKFLAPNETFNDTETYIYGASDLSSLGDLSPLYCGYIDVSMASKLTTLQIGNSKPGYKNLNLHKLSVGANQLLKKIDITNCVNLVDPLDVSQCKNIEEIYAGGSGITSVVLPESGYLRIMKLPSTITNLTITNQLYLETLDFENYKSLTTLCIDNCPTIDAVSMLNRCKDDAGKFTVNRVRITGIKPDKENNRWWFSSIDALKELYPLKGIDSNGQNSDHAYLVGTCHIDNVSGEDIAELKSYFPYLEVEYNTLSLKVTFMSYDGEEILHSSPITLGAGNTSQGATIECPYKDAEDKDKPKKPSTENYHYHFGGWSKKKDSEPDEDALVGIIANTVLYAAFTAEWRNYIVNFYNGRTLIGSVETPYLGTAVPPYEPTKDDTNVENVWIFSSWIPSNQNITGDTNCYAQYYYLETDEDIKPFAKEDFDYTLNEVSKTVTINKYKGTEFGGRLGNTFTISTETDTEYSVTAISGYRESNGGYVGAFEKSSIELIVLPESLKSIGSQAFQSCSKLVAINIPQNVSSIGQKALMSTSSLSSIKVHEGNGTYCSINNCLIKKNTGVILAGCKSSIIPTDSFVTTIGEYSFWGCTGLINPVIPDNIKTISSYAFTDCSGITKIEFPSSVEKFGTMCLYGTSISEVTFPENTTLIGIFAVREARNLKTIWIQQPNSSKITLEENALMQGSQNRNKMTIYIPWAKEEVMNKSGFPWGVTNATFKCNDGEIEFEGGEQIV